jgi:hypothetical protein
MRFAPYTIAPLLLLACCAVTLAQQEAKTDLQRDDLAGPVRSVSSTRLSEASKEQLKNIAFGVSPGCTLCAYDRDGNKVSEGQIADGNFVGNQTAISHDPDGTTERVLTTVLPPPAPGTSQGPAMIRRELDGPFGEVNSTLFLDGKVQLREVRNYDAKGHLSETWIYDGAGAIMQHETYRWTEDGQRKDWELNGKGDAPVLRLTWDPETDESRLTGFDLSGAVVESWSVAHGKILSFWEDSDEQGANHAHSMFDDGENGEFTVYECRKSNGCKVEHHYSQFLGPGKRNIRHTDFRDSAGNLKWASDYEYELDSHGNWTHRKVWVTFPGEGGRVLSSEDDRTITYWEP